MIHVFLSYSRTDKQFMQRLRDDLRSRGVNVWTDEQIKPGTSWQDAIEDAIAGSYAIVVIYSPDAAKSEWVEKELAYGKGLGVKVFPVLVRGDVHEAIPFEHATTQFIDFRNSDSYLSGLETLVYALFEHLKLVVGEGGASFDVQISRADEAKRPGIEIRDHELPFRKQNWLDWFGVKRVDHQEVLSDDENTGVVADTSMMKDSIPYIPEGYSKNEIIMFLLGSLLLLAGLSFAMLPSDSQPSVGLMGGLLIFGLTFIFTPISIKGNRIAEEKSRVKVFCSTCDQFLGTAHQFEKPCSRCKSNRYYSIKERNYILDKPTLFCYDSSMIAN